MLLFNNLLNIARGTKEKAAFAYAAAVQNHLGSKLSKKKYIKVVFFVLYDSMWKNDRLFKMMMESDRFDPYVISISHSKQSVEMIEDNQKRLRSFFEKKGFPFIEGYDSLTDRWFDIKTFNPDIVFYQQPYNDTCDEYRIKSLLHNCVMCYIPYAYAIEDSSFFYNTYLLNIAWKLFYPTVFQFDDAKRFAINHGKNVVVSGYPLEDYVVPGQRTGDGKWKQKDVNIKRVIWAPHHSILNDDMLSYSLFLEMADQMVELAKKYSGKIQFAFKPHPVLKEKLCRQDVWGIERTEGYYKLWEDMQNTCIAQSEYIDLFNSSDAMIHDCSSFTVEYLHTWKPVMYLTRKNHEPEFNECGKMGYRLHYKGGTVNDIEQFLDVVVLGGDDTMINQRKDFYNKYLLPPGGTSVAECIFNEVNK